MTTETVRLDSLVRRLRLLAAWQKPGGPMPTEPPPNKYATAAEAADAIERLSKIAAAALRSVNNPAWSGVCDEDVELEDALREAGLLTPNG